MNAALVEESDALTQDTILKRSIAELKRCESFHLRAGDKMGERGQESKPADSQGGADLIRIEGQSVFTLPEIDLNIPTVSVVRKDGLRGQGSIHTQKARKAFGIRKTSLGQEIITTAFSMPLSGPS